MYMDGEYGTVREKRIWIQKISQTQRKSHLSRVFSRFCSTLAPGSYGCLLA